MKFELNGNEYFTEEKMYTQIYRYNDRGQKMVCVFGELPLHPSLVEVVLHMKSIGAKVAE